MYFCKFFLKYEYVYIFVLFRTHCLNHPLHFCIAFVGKSVSTIVAGFESSCDVTSVDDSVYL